MADFANFEGEVHQVAVKLVRISAAAHDKEQFLGEAELMLSLDHINILKVEGLCLARKPWLLVAEYMMHKDLGVVLRMCKRVEMPLRMHEFFNFAVQIVEGAKYLAFVRALFNLHFKNYS